MLPNFICPGSQKSGTSLLQKILEQHPQIYLPKIKETNFFNFSYRFVSANTVRYESQFYSNVEKSCTAIGEICPDYLLDDKNPNRISSLLGPDIKLIFILREPVDRAFSAYKMFSAACMDCSKNFKKAIHNDQITVDRRFHYIERGAYATRIKEYLKYFKKENMMFLVFEEDIKKNLQHTIIKILKFLEVDPNVELNLDFNANPTLPSKFEVLQKDYVIFKQVKQIQEPKKTEFKNKIKNILLRKKKEEIYKQEIDIIIPKGSIRYSIKGEQEKYIFNPSEKVIKEINSYNFQSRPPSKNYRQELIEKYFYDEIKEVEKIISRDLTSIYLNK